MKRNEQRGPKLRRAKSPGDSRVFPQSSVLSPQSLEVHIEELVLHGFAPGDRRSIGDAVERELTRLLVEQGVPLLFAQDSEVKGLDAGRFAVAEEARGGTIGAQIAQAVYGGIRE